MHIHMHGVMFAYLFVCALVDRYLLEGICVYVDGGINVLTYLSEQQTFRMYTYVSLSICISIHMLSHCDDAR